jgi:hypothetical protein
LTVGINCAYHPSKEAVTRCDKCGKFICDDCFDVAWDGVGGVSSTNGRYCHACIGDAVDSVGVSLLRDAKILVKKGIFWVVTLPVLGFIIGFVITLIYWIGSGRIDATELLFASLGSQFGCMAWPFFRWVSYMFVEVRKILKGEGELIGGLKALKGMTGGLVFGMIAVAFTWFIIPIIYYVKRRRQLKEIGPMIERYPKLCATLRNAHAKPGDPAIQAEIRQGAAKYAADMKVVDSIHEPILWFFR